MILWLKKNWSVLLTVLVTGGFVFYLYGCESKTKSLLEPTVQITRQELQLELDQLISLAQIRMLDLDRQEEFKSIILQNALILVQGQPTNPVGILTGIAALYGLTQAGSNAGRVIKNKRNKRKENNATS